MHLASRQEMDGLHVLRSKLCRELAQSERSADVHTRREARRLGDVPPAAALRALGEHARSQRSRFEELACRGQSEEGLQVGRVVGGLFSLLRAALFDRVIDVERSYRGTLLGFRHGVDVMRLLREVALRLGEYDLAHFCDDWLARRIELLTRAERHLAWFADTPERALQSGLRISVAPK